MAQSTVGGYTPVSIVSTASDNAQNIKSAPGVVASVIAMNINVSPRYLKFYDKATAPAPSTDTPVFVVPMPGNTSGSGAAPFLSNITFAKGIGIAIVGGIASNNDDAVGAGDCVVSFGYR
jgi:hypothetical protein